MLAIRFKNTVLFYGGSFDFVSKILDYAKSLGAETDGDCYYLKRAEHITLVEKYAEKLK